MCLKVIDCNQRLASRQRQRLGRRQPHHDAADQSRAGGGGDGIEVIQRCTLRRRQRLLYDAVQPLDMGAGRDLRHHAAIGAMGVELAEHDVGQDHARPGRSAPDDGAGRFVAAGLDPQDRQGAQSVWLFDRLLPSSKPFAVMSQNRTLRLGTRGSKLALVQANMVRDALIAKGAACEIVILKTSGDRIQDRSLADAGGKGLFVKELEDALLNETIDLAVHSMKDVPTALPPGLSLSAFLEREDPSEAFLSHSKFASLDALPKGGRVGTSSVRRQAQALRRRPDLDIVLLRGNVDTRLRKLDDGEMDAMFLALAGLRRLGLQGRATAILDPKDWLPSLGQGVVGIEIRETDTHAREMTATLNHEITEFALTCERAFQAALDGSCRTPIAGLATVEGGTLTFNGEVLAPDGTRRARPRISHSISDTIRARRPRMPAPAPVPH